VIPALYFGVMSDKTLTEFHQCPACDGKGTVPSRLPFRTKPSEHCGGRGVVTPIRRQQLLAKLKARERV
jgi:DnaJ-class molecular chaperone